VLGALEDPRALDLAVAPGGDDAGGRFVDRRIGVEHLHGRARRVRHHERTVAGAGTAAGEPAVVGVLPAVRHAHPVRAQRRPPRLPPVGAEVVDRRQQEREAGRGGGRVLDDEQVLVLGLGEVLERRGHRRAVVGEPGLVVVDAHVAVVDRGDPVLGIELELRVDVVEGGRGVRHEQPLVEGTGEERGVDPEQHVGLGVAVREDGLVHHGAGVAALHELHLHARVLGELGQHRVGDREGVVGEEADRHATLARGVAATVVAAGGHADDQCEGHHEPHQGAWAAADPGRAGHGVVLTRWVPAEPGWTARSVPSRRVTTAVAAESSLLTPRVVPTGRSSSTSG
jgi:hypothetical protein